MAGRGPAPKPGALRQRRNSTATKATLPTTAAARSQRVPELPASDAEDGWHPMVLEWWESVWRSPMAGEFLDADMRGGLYLLADLYQVRWTVRDDPRALAAAAAEIRLQEVRFGLSPIDRRRLQWEVEKGEQAVEKTKSRKKVKRTQRADPARDPRSVLKVVA